MSKIITSLALLSIGIVGYAQDTPPTGRVGINTTNTERNIRRLQHHEMIVKGY